MPAKLLGTRVWEERPNTLEIYFDFEGDRHHALRIEAGADHKQVAGMLEEFAAVLRRDDLLMDSLPKD